MKSWSMKGILQRCLSLTHYKSVCEGIKSGSVAKEKWCIWAINTPDNKSITWNEASAMCQSAEGRGHLVIIKDMEMMSFIRRFVYGVSVSPKIPYPVFLGLKYVW